MTDYNGMIVDLYEMAGEAKRNLLPDFALHIRLEIIEIRKNWRIDQPLCGCAEDGCYRNCRCACHRKQASGAPPLPVFTLTA